VATIVHGAGIGGLDPQAAAQAVVEASLLENYTMPRESSRSGPDAAPTELTVVEFGADRLPAVAEGVRVGQIIAESVILARDLIATPANIATPTYLAESARRMAAAVGLRCTILERDQAEALGMGIFLAVAKGSDEPPKFVILEHNAHRAEELPTLVLVGKGITFDTGGYSLKVNAAGETMWRMKYDMTGAADVFAVLRAAALLDLPLHVVGLAPLCENMISGRAQRPGDVYRGLSGKTVEIISTDAEGRLILADALAYAGRYRPQAVIDLATLTGAIGVALGPKAAGLFCNDDRLRERLLAAAAVTGERLWPMPMYDDYAEDIRSDVADVKNSTLPVKNAGVSTSAKFLEHFTEGYPWAHIDLANMAWADPGRPLYPKGATAFGVRLLVQCLRDWQP
jgi:leucyl aminopeptidase